MTQALFYQPSWLRLQEQIRAIAPDLDIVLLDEDGGLSRDGQRITEDDIAPQWFWLHMELFVNEARREDFFRLLLQSPSAVWLHTVNTGLDGLPYLDVYRKGVTLSNNHAQSVSIAEFVIGQLLSHYQNVAALRQQQAREEWRYLRFQEICGSHWLMVGFGAIGKDIALRARAFGASISAVRRKQDGEGLADQVWSQEQIHEALAQADVVVLACSSNDRTRGMVDADFLAAMKPGSALINIARGDLVVEDDLHQALDAGKPALAILDVFNQEPPAAGSWVWQHPSVLLSPHSSNAGSGMVARSDELFLENLRRMVSSRPLLNPVTDADFN